MTLYHGTCCICGKPVQAPETVAYKITGWSYASAHKAAGSVIGRTRTGEVAHKVCVEYPGVQDEPLFAA